MARQCTSSRTKSGAAQENAELLRLGGSAQRMCCIERLNCSRSGFITKRDLTIRQTESAKNPW